MTTEADRGPATKGAVAPYALKKREGWVYDLGVQFTVKLGERGHGRRFAVLEYTTVQDEWPGHTHTTEDESFYVLKGARTFGFVIVKFDVDEGGLAFLPTGTEHGYRISGGKRAQVLLVRAPGPVPAPP